MICGLPVTLNPQAYVPVQGHPKNMRLQNLTQKKRVYEFDCVDERMNRERKGKETWTLKTLE